MKKKSNVFVKLFKIIASFFDKILITPISKLLYKLGKLLNRVSKFISNMSGNKSFLLVVSLILAFTVFIMIDRESDITVDQYAEVLYDQPVTAVYNEELYVIEGLPDTVDITLVGQKRHIFLAKQSPSQGVTVDLTGLKPGQHKVKLKYSQKLRSLDYKLDPSEVTINIYKKESTTKSLTYDILHNDDLDSKLFISKVTLDRNEVIVKGSKNNINKVASVKALVDVDELNAKKSGEFTLKDVPLVAYDNNGKIIDVEIVPNTITCKVVVTSPSKDVAIKVIPTGTVALGKSIKSIETNISKITVYGKESVVDQLDQIEVKVDVDGLSKNKTFNVNIEKPDGITDISDSQITVTVVLDSSTTKTIKNISIVTENLPDGFTASAQDASNSTVDVLVTGSKESLKSLTSDNIKAFVDLSNVKPGPNKVNVQVTGDDVTLKYEVISNKTVSIVVAKK